MLFIKGTKIIIDGQTFNTKWTDNIEICNLKSKLKEAQEGHE
jgi:hypothetical protein